MVNIWMFFVAMRESKEKRWITSTSIIFHYPTKHSTLHTLYVSGYWLPDTQFSSLIFVITVNCSLAQPTSPLLTCSFLSFLLLLSPLCLHLCRSKAALKRSLNLQPDHDFNIIASTSRVCVYVCEGLNTSLQGGCMNRKIKWNPKGDGALLHAPDTGSGLIPRFHVEAVCWPGWEELERSEML